MTYAAELIDALHSAKAPTSDIRSRLDEIDNMEGSALLNGKLKRVSEALAALDKAFAEVIKEADELAKGKRPLTNTRREYAEDDQ